MFNKIGSLCIVLFLKFTAEQSLEFWKEVYILTQFSRPPETIFLPCNLFKFNQVVTGTKKAI